MPTIIRARSRAQLTAVDLHLQRGGRPVLTGVDLAVGPGSRIGIVGENGRGKSTLLHALAGRIPADSGAVARVGSLALVEQELRLVDDGARTVGELIDAHLADAHAALAAVDDAASALADDSPEAADAFQSTLDHAEALDAWDADRRADAALTALGAVSDRSAQFTALSVGQRARVRLACVLAARDDLLLLDEPTNHLDAEGLDFLTRAIREWPGGVVLVSHDRALLEDVVERFVDLDPSVDGRPRVSAGGYEGWVDDRRRARERWQAEHRAQLDERERLHADLQAAQACDEGAWRPEKGTGKHTRATRAAGTVRAVHRRRERLEAHAVSAPPPPLALSVPALPRHRGTVLAAQGLPQGELSLRAGDRLVIAGPNGSGKSTLLDVLAGHRRADAGTVRHASDARIALLTQESEPLGISARSVAELYERRAGELVASRQLRESQVVPLAHLGLLGPAERGRRPVELSTGQRRRLDLALALLSRPHLLLLDEPTNHLSIGLVDELTEAMLATDAAVVIATHDRWLLRRTARWPRLELS